MALKDGTKSSPNICIKQKSMTYRDTVYIEITIFANFEIKVEEKFASLEIVQLQKKI